MLGIEIARGWAQDIADGWKDIPSYEVDSEKLKHLAIICDGNRRAALELHFEPQLGHLVGLEVVRGIARAGRAWGIEALTFWVWSTNNWNRGKSQVDFVIGLAQEQLSKDDFLQELVENHAKFTHLGRKDRLSPTLQKTVKKLEESTKNFDHYQLNLALDYGGEDEIYRAIDKMSRTNVQNPQAIWQFLDTADQPPVDLVIRTAVMGQELPHTSGFMPLQTIDACWIFMPDLFPNLTPDRLLWAIKKFESYDRRLGK